MPLTDNQRMFAMYVIGEVESNWNWTSVNYNDPITVGMMQWYGTRAAALLNRCQSEDAEGFAMLAGSLRSDLASHDASSSWWTSRYLTRTEGNSFVTMAERDENHVIQQSQFFEDLAGYESTLTSWGCATDTTEHIKTFIYFCVAYHQGPAYCGQVMRNTGGTCALSTAHNGVLNNRVLGQYRNRYNTAYARLAAWDGASAPPDFGQVDQPDTTPGGDGGTTIPQIESQIHHIEMRGDQLFIYGKDNQLGLICYKGAGNQWLPQRNSAAPNTPGGGSSGGSAAPSSLIGQMIQLWYDHEGEWSYGQGAGRLSPETSGYSDCSACIWWAINKISPEIAQRVGTWTGAMVDNGTLVAQGNGPGTVDTSILEPGDIVLIDWGGYTSTFDHVEWYVGNDTLWGAGSAPLPHNSGNINTYLSQSRVERWMIRRVITE